jgi:hypothetical protein
MPKKSQQLIEANISMLKMKEREHLHDGDGYVCFDGEVTINGHELKFDLNIKKSDGSVKAAKGKWLAYIDVNKRHCEDRYDWRNKDNIAAAVVRCNLCANRHTALVMADVIFSKLRLLGYDIYECSYHVGGWGGFYMYPDSVKYKGEKNSRRQFYYKLLTEIVCPVHGRFIQEDEECSL